jgi:DNA-binding MarR family transcriptional regulator
VSTLSEALTRVMDEFALNPGLRPTSRELIRRTHCPRHQVLRALKQLVRSGIVEVTQVTHNERIYRLSSHAKELLL